MKKEKSIYSAKGVMPYLGIAAIIGIITGFWIFLFKIASSLVIWFSGELSASVRETPIYLPLFLVAAGLLGFLSGFVLKRFKDCRGGGIPTAVASIRGYVPLKWLQGLFVLFGSSMLTYLGGVPLGNEGPSVQMGTAIGKGTMQLLGKKRRAFERYAMTSGACAGFATATGAPLTGIVFALEEAHRRFSPILFLVASISVLTGTTTQHLLCELFDIDPTFFGFAIEEVLPLRELWIPVVIGICCGFAALAFTRLYSLVRALEHKFAERAPYLLKIVVIFVLTALLGVLCEDFIGSGHSLIEKVMHRESVWFLLVLALLIRAVLLTVANSRGVSGGLFVPTLTFGALIAALLSEGALRLGLVDEKYYSLLIVIGMAAFLSGSSRTPITAITFAAEALCGVGNILPVGIAVVIAYLIGEVSGVIAFTDNVIDKKVEATHRGKTPIIVDVHMTVGEGTFADGKDLADILWPPTCRILSVHRSDVPHHGSAIVAGDCLHLHYQTFEPTGTLDLLEAILGKQENDPNLKAHFGSDDHVVPLE